MGHSNICCTWSACHRMSGVFTFLCVVGLLVITSPSSKSEKVKMPQEGTLYTNPNPKTRFNRDESTDEDQPSKREEKYVECVWSVDLLIPFEELANYIISNTLFPPFFLSLSQCYK